MIGGVRSKPFVFRRQEFLEAIFVDGFHVCFVRADDTLLHDMPDRIVHELHPLALAADDHILKLLRRALTNDRAHRIVGDEDSR